MRIILLGFFFFLTQSLAVASDRDGLKVLLLMSSHGSAAKSELLTTLAADQPFELHVISGKSKTEEEIEALWQSSDLVMLDGINPALSKMMFSKYAKHVDKFSSVPVISLGDLTNIDMNNGLKHDIHTNLGRYYGFAGRSNYRNMMAYISGEIFQFEEVSWQPPKAVPHVGFYHPKFLQQVTDDENVFFQFLELQPKQPVIAIAIHRSVVDYEQQQIVDALINGLESKGAKAFGIFFEGNDKALKYTDLLIDEQDKTRVDLLINYRSLHYVDKRRKEFETIGVPVIHALNYTEGDEQQFEQDVAGVSAALTPFFLVMPEDTGSTDPSIIAANVKGKKQVMQPQLDALVERAFNHASLKYIDNKNKKVATFIWNYPPGEKNIGAAFLDVPSSIEQISLAMKEKGYSVDTPSSQYLIEAAGQLLRPYYRSEDAEQLVDKGLADYLPLEEYLTWFNQLPEGVKQPIVERWGAAESSEMLRETDDGLAFVIPRISLGNMIILPQGMRGDNQKTHANLYHSTKTPINHRYLAIYLYTRKVFAANAYIHLGTHGSQEWLTGKERGLSVNDAPNLAVGNVPVFYPYIIDNVGEAMQAKRRGRATMISHLTPGFAKAGLYAEISALNEKIANYMMLDEGQTKLNTQNEIKALASELNVLQDLTIAEADFDLEPESFINQIQDQLNQLSQMSQPLGVHTFGLLPKEAHQYSTILQMLGDSFTSKASEYERAHNLQLKSQLDRLDTRHLEALDGFQLLKQFIDGRQFDGLDDALHNDLHLAKQYWDNFQNIAEIANLMGAMEGQYIPVSHGGDPIRNPNAVPTGRNLIGFNPAKVPSKEAYDAGVKLMNQTINDYLDKHDKYPEKLAFSLWSLETMRHQGALEAQVLHALGIKPLWNRQGNIIGTEVIPYSELKRPRIDVVITATGLYRDAFPNVMLWLAEAIDKVAKMKEDNNFVYRHSEALKNSLLQKGKSAQDADYLSSLRIFSNETGNYGTGLAASSLASGTWQEDTKLANLYLDRMGYAYGKDENRWSENTSGDAIYRQVLSGTDAVIFSRSTNLYALMTNDDPFQYFGGIGLAVRHLDGETPEMYVSNLRKKDNLKAQTLETFVSQEMRSRYFHPRWIQAMQESGYAGATAILDRMNNMWGWEVMTPEAIRDDQWNTFFDVYIEDKYQLNMQAFFEANNAEALAQILERMLEAVRKGYWQADQKVIEKMIEKYSELATRHDVVTDNEMFNQYVDEQSIGFGLLPLSQLRADLNSAMTPAPKQVNYETESTQVSGQKLTEQSVSEKAEVDYTWLWSLFGVFILGSISQFLLPSHYSSQRYSMAVQT